MVVVVVGDRTRTSRSVCQLLGRRSSAASICGALNCRRLGFAVADLVVAVAGVAVLDDGGDGVLVKAPPVTPLGLALSVWCRCGCCCGACGRLPVGRVASLPSRRSGTGMVDVLGRLMALAFSRAGSHQPPTPLRQVGRRAWLCIMVVSVRPGLCV